MAQQPVATLNPINPKDFGFAQARHLLSRAGFGGTPQQVHDLHRKGLNAAVDYLVDYEKIPVGPDAQTKRSARNSACSSSNAAGRIACRCATSACGGSSG